MCGPGKHNCQPFCGPEGRFDCSNSVCSLQPAPFSYLCMRVRILGVMKIVCCYRIKPDCRMPAVVSIFADYAACVLSFYHSTPLYKYIPKKSNGHVFVKELMKSLPNRYCNTCHWSEFECLHPAHAAQPKPNLFWCK